MKLQQSISLLLISTLRSRNIYHNPNNMRSFVFLSMLVAVALAASAPLSPEQLRLRLLPALQHEETHDERGQYALRYVTAEGTVVSERGYLVPNADNTDYVLVYEGEYTYIDEEGKPIVTKYTSGLDGFKAEGDHLPKAPEVPAV